MENSRMKDYFGAEHQEVGRGARLGLRALIALDIIKHCALVAGKVDGEDTAGRSRIVEMPSPDVATRANDIAAALVNEWETRGWLKPETMSAEEAVTYAGKLERLKSREAYKTAREELTGKKED